MEHHVIDSQLWAHTNTMISLSAAAALYVGLHNIILVIYRLGFSNLSSFPWPKVAAATYWYEFYYDWLKGGKYIFVIEEMHKQYGKSTEGFLLGILGRSSRTDGARQDQLCE